jgi:Cu(I)/Ag(I) efflux system membrane fusion protein
LKKAQDIQAARTEFSPLSQEVGVLAKTFGFGQSVPIYELHCPMAFQGLGAIWYQGSDQVRNPYYGSTMLSCADRVEQVVHDEPPVSNQLDSHENHSQH